MTRRWGLALGVIVAAGTLAAGVAVARGGGYYLSNNAPVEPAHKGVVITVHGGGWKNYGAEADQVMSLYIDDYTSWGFRVDNLGHRAGRKSLTDTIDAVKRVSRKNPDVPLCLFGGSSGANLVLMADAAEPKLIDCVIAQAPIADLVRPDSVPAWSIVHDLAVSIWGKKHLTDISPMQHAKEIRDPVLLIQPDCDPVTTVARQQKFASKLKRAKLLVQQGGDGYDTGHCPLTWESVYEGFGAQRSFLERFAG